MPSIRRDLSIVVDSSVDSETLGDRIRDQLGDRARAVEEISVLAEHPFAALPAKAQTRLGMKERQKNVLLRVVISDLERTLTHEEANQLRNAVYSAVHEGPQCEWAKDSKR